MRRKFMDNLYNYNMFHNLNNQFVCPLLRQIYNSVQNPVNYYGYSMESYRNPEMTTYEYNYDYTSYIPMTFVPLSEIED